MKIKPLLNPFRIVCFIGCLGCIASMFYGVGYKYKDLPLAILYSFLLLVMTYIGLVHDVVMKVIDTRRILKEKSFWIDFTTDNSVKYISKNLEILVIDKRNLMGKNKSRLCITWVGGSNMMNIFYWDQVKDHVLRNLKK